MHFLHFTDVIGCNNMLMLKVCKSFCKFAKVFASFWSIYFILFYFTCERGIIICRMLCWNMINHTPKLTNIMPSRMNVLSRIENNLLNKFTSLATVSFCNRF